VALFREQISLIPGKGEGTAALEDGTFEIELSGRLTITAIGYSPEQSMPLMKKSFIL
jgi:hypothetical protein